MVRLAGPKSLCVCDASIIAGLSLSVTTVKAHCCNWALMSQVRGLSGLALGLESRLVDRSGAGWGSARNRLRKCRLALLMA